MTLPYVLLCVAVLGAVALLVRRGRRRPTAAASEEVDPGSPPVALASLEARIEALETAARTPAANEALGTRLDALEARLRREIAAEVSRRLASRPATTPPPAAAVGPSTPAGGGLEEALRGEGYARPRLLGPGPEAGTWRVEVERGGIVRKGVARFDAEHGLELDLEASLRAFP